MLKLIIDRHNRYLNKLLHRGELVAKSGGGGLEDVEIFYKGKRQMVRLTLSPEVLDLMILHHSKPRP